MQKRGYHNFLSKICCLTVPKNFVGEPFCVSEKCCYRKMLGTRQGAGITISRRFFCLTVPKKIVGDPFSVSLISGISDNFSEIIKYLARQRLEPGPTA